MARLCLVGEMAPLKTIADSGGHFLRNLRPWGEETPPMVFDSLSDNRVPSHAHTHQDATMTGAQVRRDRLKR